MIASIVIYCWWGRRPARPAFIDQRLFALTDALCTAAADAVRAGPPTGVPAKAPPAAGRENVTNR
jgi:hypothetical protein